jgi:D-sedoheptulose 7-phosphate isomerase
MNYHYVDELIARHPTLSNCKPHIEHFCNIAISSYKQGGKVLICGNGGSSSDAAHIVGELMKGFLKRRELSLVEKKRLSEFGKDGVELADNLQGSLGAIDLSAFHALSTAVANDINADYIYAQSLLGLGVPGDVFVGISTSGNARNVAFAAITAKAKGLKLVGLTGSGGGKMLKQGIYDIIISVPEDQTYRIQEEHIAVYHAVCATVEEEIYNG